MSERLQVDLQTFSRQWGDRSGSLTAAIEQAVRSHADYRAFLERFMASGEAMLLNDAEFDPVFYTYGLTLYRNLPLIEPLESREVRRIRDLVIALDTSGSTSGRLVQAFVRQTGAILSQNESFFRAFNVYIIQCDARIQSVVHLTRAEDFARYTAGETLHGLGGTDFRPVFQLVDQMIADRKLSDLKGLIYFTDGLGVFPEKKPAYATAFVFLDEDGRDRRVPPWAIRLVLRGADIGVP
jgi:predicted metal-dependent peptidase